MNLQQHLNDFYVQHNIPENGGEDHKTFEVPLPFLKLILPNFSWRKKMLYIHDLEHILNHQDTTWRGEIFIASWEIATGFWKYFPICIFPLWTMGWGLWKHPSSVFSGFKKGSQDVGIAELSISKERILQLSLAELQNLILGKKQVSKYLKLRFLFFTFISQIIFLAPIIVSALILFYFFS